MGMDRQSQRRNQTNHHNRALHHWLLGLGIIAQVNVKSTSRHSAISWHLPASNRCFCAPVAELSKSGQKLAVHLPGTSILGGCGDAQPLKCACTSLQMRPYDCVLSGAPSWDQSRIMFLKTYLQPSVPEYAKNGDHAVTCPNNMHFVNLSLACLHTCSV